MLGFLFVVVGAMFILVGLNGALGAGGSGDPERPRPPIPGGAIRRGDTTPRTRRIAGAAWVALGVIFIVAAFTHQVP